MSGFDAEKFKDWQRNTMARTLAMVAKVAKAEGSSYEYVLAMVFGAGAMTAATVVREVLEAGKLPDEVGLAIAFADAFDSVLGREEAFRKEYDKANGIKRG